MKMLYLLAVTHLSPVCRGYAMAMVIRHGFGLPWWAAVIAVVIGEAWPRAGAVAAMLLSVRLLRWPWWQALLFGFPEAVSFLLALPAVGVERASFLLAWPWYKAGLMIGLTEGEDSRGN